MACSLIVISAGDQEEAKILARGLVETGLVASANILAPMTSFFTWIGILTERQEVLVLAKTTAEQVGEVTAFVVSRHGYDCPSVIALPIDGGHQPYLDWIETSCSKAGEAKEAN